MNYSLPTSSMMRVLVADPNFEQRVVIDKSLGFLGYFRVCPVASFDELINLTHYSPNFYDRFDLLIINAELVSSAGRDVVNFVMNNPRLKHVLISGPHGRPKDYQPLTSGPQHQVRLVDTVNYYVLVDFLLLIDKTLKYRRVSEIRACVADAQYPVTKHRIAGFQS